MRIAPAVCLRGHSLAGENLFVRPNGAWYCRQCKRELDTVNPRTATRAYRSWSNMKKRCGCPTYRDYPRYGGRGITVCERWQAFDAFLADMGEPPEGSSIERIDNARGYEPANCRWATVAEQARNRRSNIVVTYRGERMVLWDACRIAGVPFSVAQSRRDRGWPEDLWLTESRPGVSLASRLAR